MVYSNKFQCRILFALSVLCLFQLQTVASAGLQDGAVLIYTFDRADMQFEDDKPIQIVDVSGNENHGVINGRAGKSIGGLPPDIVQGRFGDALQFHGWNWIEAVDSESLRVTDELTIVAWIKPETVMGDPDDPDQQFHELNICTKYRGYALQLRNQGLIAVKGWGLADWYESPDPVPVNQWSHIAVSWDGSKLVQYLNGQEVLSASIRGTITHELIDPLSIGAEVMIKIAGDYVFSKFYTGLIDEVGIFDVSKTAQEINEMMPGILAVSAQGKVALTWGGLKRMIH